MSGDPRSADRCAAFGNWYDDNVFVLVTKKPDRLRAFLESMGLEFEEEKHKGGPVHWAAQVGDKILEIYPPKKNKAP